MASLNVPRIAHLHIPKTAGMALRQALLKRFGSELRVFVGADDASYAGIEPADYDYFGGHFGFDTANKLDANIVTVMRNPYDRFVSVYYFWRQLYAGKFELSKNTKLASLFSLEDFALLSDQLGLIQEFKNRMTWQIAYGSSNSQRERLRLQGISDTDLFTTAIANLEIFSVVGFQERMQSFTTRIRDRFCLSLDIAKENVTSERVSVDGISDQAKKNIHPWISLDLELYQYALDRFG